MTLEGGNLSISRSLRQGVGITAAAAAAAWHIERGFEAAAAVWQSWRCCQVGRRSKVEPRLKWPDGWAAVLPTGNFLTKKTFKHLQAMRANGLENVEQMGLLNGIFTRSEWPV